MSHSNTFMYYLSNIFHQLWTKISGIPPVLSYSEEKETPGEILSQRHSITCKCGWHGRGSDSLREYYVLTEKTVELKLFCKKCRQYLGYIIYKDAA